MTVLKFDFADDHRFGPSQVLDWLFLAGEEDVDEVVYGKLMTPSDVSSFSYYCKPQIQYWIDFNDMDLYHPHRRHLIYPSTITFLRMPFTDGDAEALQRTLPLAKIVLDSAKREGSSVLISCQGGVSRSATLALWCMAEEMGYSQAWDKLKFLRPHVEPHDNFQNFIDSTIKIL